MSAARILHAQLHLLDRQIVAAGDERLIGKVDDLELAAGDGPPYVTAILTGPLALAPRIGGVPGRLMAAVTELFRPEEDPGPQRIPMSLVAAIGSAVKVGGDPREAALERWVRHHLIGPLPGSGVSGPPADHRPARIGDAESDLRAGALLQYGVTDAAGEPVGRVADIQLTQDGPLLAETQHAFRISGLIAVPRHTGQLFGYERGGAWAPWLVSAIIRRLHRGSVVIRWDQIADLGDPVRLVVRREELAPLTDLWSASR